MPGRNTIPLSIALQIVAFSFVGVATLAGQTTARVTTQENFRREPNGVILGRLSPGASLTVVQRDSSWLEADLEGWIWLPSLQVSDTEFDLAVSAPQGENLRDGPSGSVVGRLEEGVLLEELGREPGWVHVRRRGWIWAESVSEATASAPRETPAAPASGSTRTQGFASVGSQGAAILTAPDGDTLGLVSGRSDLEVLSRQGNWARVRLDGWIWDPEAGEPAAASGQPAAGVGPDELQEDPDAYVGRVVSWTLQFISLEQAEAVRTDFREGEPFLLTRFGASDGPFVYVAVPPERESEIEGLIPLEMVRVTARVRTGASSLTGTPIVDLIGLERER